jgi:hypothetical protein
MLETKLVIRILDSEGSLLGWTQVVGKAYGDGTLRVDDPATVVLDHAGTPVTQSIHWCDVNVEVKVPLADTKHLDAGASLELRWGGPILNVGPAAGGLPPVTVKTPVRIDAVAGGMGIKSGH